MAGIPKLIVLSAQLRGQKFELEGKDEFALGRTEESDFPVPDPTISGHHCTLFVLEDGRFAVRDEGSTNGTRLNNEKLEPGDEQVLKNGDILQAGGVEMLFDNESSRSEGSATQTVISLKDTDTSEVSTEEMGNLGGHIQKKNSNLRQDSGKSNMVAWAILGVLGLTAVILLVVMLLKTLSPPAS
jgi:pSer/pThr/pTyr-binding forkhead associated (FHA) protein